MQKNIEKSERLFALAPSIKLTPNSTTMAIVVKSGDPITITCTPRIRDRKDPASSAFESIQNVIVWFGDQVVKAPVISNQHPLQKDQPTTITFKVPDVENGLYVVRLRVDNVDSIPVILKGPAQIAIDGSNRVWVANREGSSLSAFTKSGVAISPPTGYQSAGLSNPRGLAIDASGNIWLTNFTADSLTEFIGIATPSATPISPTTHGQRP